jgi:predicted transcriptional regulator
MKTASIPSLRVAPELRQAAEDLLEPGETLSGFVEQSIRAGIERRRMRKAFIARGLASRDEAKRTGEYFAAEEIRDELDAMLLAAESRTDAAQ